MIALSGRVGVRGVAGLAAALALTVCAASQQDKPEKHSRRYKPLEPAVKITVLVEKAANGKPISNAAVIFRAMKNGKNEGSLEIKSDPDGHAMIDVIEVGSHVKVQVIADGFSTAALEFDVPNEVKDVTVRMEKPRAQISTYDDGLDRPSQRPAGVQEPPPIVKRPKKTMPSAEPNPTTTAPLAPVTTPETAPPSAATAPAAGSATPAGSAPVTGTGNSSTVTPGAATVGAPK